MGGEQKYTCECQPGSGLDSEPPLGDESSGGDSSLSGGSSALGGDPSSIVGDSSSPGGGLVVSWR